ncbi:MAG: acetyl-CoA hydrolase/transferase family protein [Leptospiraceae bacterium]|nr:acetyl-CoA hydrolase/transferase family protein [Leptospiraceae bacterium]MCP5513126.1 acetyl-CoA hydrolase/transferase family protein [Leptospiraceae bacterium]
MNYNDWKSKAVSAEEALKLVKSNDQIFVHGAAATPTPLLDAMVKRSDLTGIKLYHLHLAGPIQFVEPQYKDQFFSYSLFTGAAMRKPIEEGRADFVPIFLSAIPSLFHSGAVKLDVAFLQLSPPDKHGYCTLGTSVDTAKAAAETAKVIIAEINEQMPRTHGNTVVPFSKVKAFIATNRPVLTHESGEETDVEARIGQIVADLVEDGSTLQMGIGGIPDAVLSRLKNKLDLGIHTEMFSDRVVELFEAGAITNKLKSVHQFRLITSFCAGSQKLYDFVNDNPSVEFHPCDRTNDPHLIRKNDKVVAINSALEIDLTGQVCADSMGHKIFSGIGGQMDFIRAAAISKGGKPIIALPATAAKGKVSRITTELKAGAGVVTTRGHVHWVATEFGAVNLFGKSLKQRAEALISIAHPDFRSELKAKISEIRHFVF